MSLVSDPYVDALLLENSQAGAPARAPIQFKPPTFLDFLPSLLFLAGAAVLIRWLWRATR